LLLFSLFVEQSRCNKTYNSYDRSADFYAIVYFFLFTFLDFLSLIFTDHNSLKLMETCFASTSLHIQWCHYIFVRVSTEFKICCILKKRTFKNVKWCKPLFRRVKYSKIKFCRHQIAIEINVTVLDYGTVVFSTNVLIVFCSTPFVSVN